MKYYNMDGDGLVIKSWCNNPEQGAIDQAMNLARLPFAFKQICLMPDTHSGYGMPIGGVLATDGVIIPYAVGYDVGCSVGAVKTSLTDISIETIKIILGKIREVIPVGYKHHDKRQDEKLRPRQSDLPDIVSKEYNKALYQLGTLGGGGGGNHFIEIQRYDDGFIGFMVHSGSRNFGWQIADHYNKVARDVNARYYSSVPKKWDLAFLPLDSDEGKNYLDEMNYCMEFATSNVLLMLERIKNVFYDVCKADFNPTIYIQHNFARMEHHFGHNVMVHRKGATSAREGEIGLIPGSQGSASYIVLGKGNPESFMSCSHGAGRAMSKTKAIETINLAEEQKKLDSKGIIHTVRNQKDVSESESAYKSIFTVMDEQRDLVDIITKLEPMAVVKG